MKKSMILALSGIFIVSTIMLCTNPNKQYEKKKKFNSPNEIVDVINHKQLGALDRYEKFVVTSDFNECLSKRKRVTGSQLDYYKIEGEILPEKNTKEKKESIIADYKKKIENLNLYEIPNEIDVITLTGKAYHIVDLYNQNNKSYISTPDNLDISMVFIDEGEGFVIDAFWISSNEVENVSYS